MLLPMTCAATIVKASHWVGFTFPGMMLDPGSFSGKLSSPSPQRGPEPRKRMSFAIFMNETARTLSAPEASTIASCAASASNLLGAVWKVRPVILEISSATLTSNPLRVLSPCADRQRMHREEHGPRTVPTAVPP